MADAEEWRALAAAAIVMLLEAEGAATQPEMEAKISDSKLAGFTHRVDPHHLTVGRRRLLAAGIIESARQATRGGQVVTTYMMTGASKREIRAAGRKRLLTARFHGWSAPMTEWGPAPLPQALERVVHASLAKAAPHGYRLLNPGGGEVTRMFGQPVAGGAVDNAAFYMPLVDGIAKPAVAVVIEAKNVRQWIYPQTQEMYQLLDKCARLKRSYSDQQIFPVLVCRRQHFRTGQMAKQMGFHVVGTWRQYVRPAVAGTPEDLLKFEQVDKELKFNLALHDSEVEEMVRHFTVTIPKRIADGATERWAAVVAEEGVPEVLRRLRDDEVAGDDRYEALRELAELVGSATGEYAEWGPWEDPQTV